MREHARDWPVGTEGVTFYRDPALWGESPMQQVADNFLAAHEASKKLTFVPLRDPVRYVSSLSVEESEEQARQILYDVLASAELRSGRVSLGTRPLSFWLYPPDEFRDGAGI
jgi:hypothetical protein